MTGFPRCFVSGKAIHEEFSQVIAGTLTFRVNLFGDNDIGFRHI